MDFHKPLGGESRAASQILMAEYDAMYRIIPFYGGAQARLEKKTKAGAPEPALSFVEGSRFSDLGLYKWRACG